MGKTTFTILLLQKIEETLGKHVPVFQFPSLTAKMQRDNISVAAMLKDRHLALTRFFITDFMRYLSLLRQYRGICIFDRFVLSTLVYQYFRFPVSDRDERVLQAVEAFLAKLEQYNIRMQHMILSGSAQRLTDRIRMQGEEITIFERGIKIEDVIEGYKRAIEYVKPLDQFSNLHIIPIEKDGAELSSRKYYQEIDDIVLCFLKAS